MEKIINGERLNSKNWTIELESGKVWQFKRREKLDVYGNPVYEIYPPYEDIKNGLPNRGIGRRNNKKQCYSSNGYGTIENIGFDKDINDNIDLKHILERFYKK